MSEPFPNPTESIASLEECLSTPSKEVIQTLSRIQGDILVLGVGGKMGPTLSRMAVRASQEAGVKRNVVGVSRFSQPGLQSSLEKFGVQTICSDLLNPAELAALPDAPNIVYMAGMKFGSTDNTALTWAMNVELPAMVCRRFVNSRFVAFSTGNIYPLVSPVTGGSLETDEPAPVGEYAMSCLGRERIFEHHSRAHAIPVSIIRLSYAVEMRYGVLIDTALKVWRGEPVDLAMSNMVAIWQGDANAQAIRSFDNASSPPCIINVTGPEFLSVRQTALRFGEIFGLDVTFTGSEGGIGLLSNTRKSLGLFGYPNVTIDQVFTWTAEWVRKGGSTLNKPTHFEATDGKF